MAREIAEIGSFSTGDPQQLERQLQALQRNVTRAFDALRSERARSQQLQARFIGTQTPLSERGLRHGELLVVDSSSGTMQVRLQATAAPWTAMTVNTSNTNNFQLVAVPRAGAETSNLYHIPLIQASAVIIDQGPLSMFVIAYDGQDFWTTF